MKYIVITCLLLLLLLGLNMAGVWYITDSAQRMEGHFAALEAAVAGQDWPRAASLFSDLERQWQQYKPKWKALLDHEDIRAMDLCFAALGVQLEQEGAQQFGEELARLRFYVRDLPDSEHLSMENLL